MFRVQDVQSCEDWRLFTCHFLTGWLVLEKWMAPDLFSMVPSVATPVISSLDASDACKSPRKTGLNHARRRMSDHSYPKAVPKHVRSFADCFCIVLVIADWC